jgi:hypothetical protein
MMRSWGCLILLDLCGFKKADVDNLTKYKSMAHKGAPNTAG